MGGKAKGDGDNDLAGGQPRWDVHCATILLQRVDGDPADETTGPIVSGQWPAARLRTKHFIPSIPHPLFAALVGATDHRMEEDGPRPLPLPLPALPLLPSPVPFLTPSESSSMSAVRSSPMSTSRSLSPGTVLSP